MCCHPLLLKQLSTVSTSSDTQTADILHGAIMSNKYVNIKWSHVWIQLCLDNQYQQRTHVATNYLLGEFHVDKTPGVLAIGTIL
jgi:hypothetical protein